MSVENNSRTLLADRVAESADFLRARLVRNAMAKPRAAIVLGSGLGSVAAAMDVAFELAYMEIPHLCPPHVEGHDGRLLAGVLGGTPILIFSGRIHGYEGYGPDETTFSVRVAGALGVQCIVLTNAAGAIEENLRPGDLVAISDQINLTGVNPAAGKFDPRLGPRFFDMTHAYSPRLRRLAQEVAQAQGWNLPEGIYLGVQGPSFETPAEIRAFHALGADLVGMSTVHETIVARQLGLEVLGISCVTNLAAGVLDQPLSHAEVTAVAASAADRLGGLLEQIASQL